MPSHVATGVSGSRGKARSRFKHYHRKKNSNVSNRYARKQDASLSNPEIEHNHPESSTRISSKGRNVARTNIPPPPRYNQRKPWPKGNVPSWLADTFESLPKKHPLRGTANDSVIMESVDPTLNEDDDNPFAYQPPSPSPTPSNTQDMAFLYPTQAKLTRAHSTPSHRIGLSSIPFAPPTFVEPTYEDHYQDIAVPLNDFGYGHEPENVAYWTDTVSGDRNSESGLPASRTTPQFASPLQMSSPIFLPGGYPPSPIATTPTFDTVSSDDITLPTPTHENTLNLQTDEIQDALCTNHPFVTSMYASSPAQSFRGFPLNALVGSRESSPRGLVSISRRISTPEVTHHKITWTPRKGVLPHADVPSRPASDVYKSRLLAYATTIADHMSSSGDESLPRQQTDKRVNLPEIERAASSPVTRNLSSLGLLDERIPNTLSKDSVASGYGNGHAVTPGLYTETLDPNDWTQLGLAGPLAEARLDRSTTVLTTFSEFGAPNNNRIGGELAPTNLGGNFNTTDTVEGVEQEDVMNEFEEDEPLVSEYYVTQEEYDVLAADEPSDDESGLTGQHQATTIQQGSEDGHPVPEVDYVVSTILETPKRGPKTQPFPMKVSRFDPVRDTTAPDESQPMLSRLSPKFVPHSRRVRPSPFAALLKKRLKDHPDAVGAKGQRDAAAGEDHEDEIEPWLG